VRRSTDASVLVWIAKPRKPVSKTEAKAASWTGPFAFHIKPLA
jgi:hypothetical protein